MLPQILRTAWRSGSIAVRWLRAPPAHIAHKLPVGARVRPSEAPREKEIEHLAALANQAGPLPLWVGYLGLSDQMQRSADEVRIHRTLGRLLAQITISLKPRTVVEFGAAFGVSGMYLGAALESTESGWLWSFEPNQLWAAFAERNISTVCKRVTVVRDTFEDSVDRFVPGPIELALIDAIHTSRFVSRQLNLVAERAQSGSVILLDDIHFSSEMSHFWASLEQDTRFDGAAEIGDRLGLLVVGSNAASRTARSTNQANLTKQRLE